MLRPPVPADLDMLLALDRRCFPPEIAYTQSELRHFLWHPGSFTAVAESGGVVAGFAVARSVRRRVTTLDEVVSSFHVITIDVAPECRREGLGTQLMEWIEARARSIRARAVVLEAAVNNHGAHGFYARHGFSITGTIPGYYHAALDALVFEKVLSADP